MRPERISTRQSLSLVVIGPVELQSIELHGLLYWISSQHWCLCRHCSPTRIWEGGRDTYGKDLAAQPFTSRINNTTGKPYAHKCQHVPWEELCIVPLRGTADLRLSLTKPELKRQLVPT
ncbi:hypothetical protein CIHG_02169 [Coccidioides immitis H538.4]|uniref:Uncharacterized protein n=1 Tax=Coccidioides immitis H538.4 TaxID=396776 RepID=A0A0J8RKC3_COCIT|nr:hypothetical protein CIHG_02169 [Coccidioides immitis H538.4]